MEIDLLSYMKKASIILLVFLIQVTASAQGTISKSWTRFYLEGEKIKKKELRRFLINMNDVEITSNVKASNRSYVGGGIMFGIGVVFMSLDKWNEKVTGNSSIPVAAGSLTMIVLGMGLIINSEIKLKAAVNRNNEIVLAPTSNGAGLIYSAFLVRETRLAIP